MIENLNDMPPDVLAEARRLQGFARRRFLMSCAAKRNHPFLDAFERDVIDGGGEVKAWGRGGVLVPELSLVELLRYSAEQILEPLRGFAIEGWHRVTPLSDAQSTDPYTWAPAVLYRDIDYLWRPPSGATRIMPDAVGLETVAGTLVTVRRWIAYRTAIVVGEVLTDTSTVADIAQAVGVGLETISADAATALSGLAAERASGYTATPDPGMRGPDSLYEG